MSKSNLRREYEARMGVVEGHLRLFNSKGQAVYCEEPSGHWSKYEYNEAGKDVYYENATGCWSRYWYQDGKEVYYESSSGVIRDNRPPKAKLVTDENGTQYKLVEITK